MMHLFLWMNREDEPVRIDDGTAWKRMCIKGCSFYEANEQLPWYVTNWKSDNIDFSQVLAVQNKNNLKIDEIVLLLTCYIK